MCSDGIGLYDSNHNILTGNACAYNGGDGIHLSGSDGSLVTGNASGLNGGYGLRIDVTCGYTKLGINMVDTVLDESVYTQRITSDDIQNETITSEDIRDNAITTNKLADAAVTVAKLAADVEERLLGPNRVTSTEIAAGAVTSEKINLNMGSSYVEDARTTRSTTWVRIPGMRIGLMIPSKHLVQISFHSPGFQNTEVMSYLWLGLKRIHNGKEKWISYCFAGRSLPYFTIYPAIISTYDTIKELGIYYYEIHGMVETGCMQVLGPMSFMVIDLGKTSGNPGNEVSGLSPEEFLSNIFRGEES